MSTGLLGFASFYEYVDRLLGYSRRFVAERLRVARALADLPRLCAAVRKGDLSWSAAREVSRVATPGTVDAWIEPARGETIRDVERAVAGHRPGDLPTDSPDDAVRRHRVGFEIEGETLALLRAAREKLTVDMGEHVDDDTLVRLLARAVLDRDAGDDAGRAGYQLAIHECDRRGAARAEGGGELVPIDPVVVEAARCDAQEIGPVHERITSKCATHETTHDLGCSRRVPRGGGRPRAPRHADDPARGPPAAHAPPQRVLRRRAAGTAASCTSPHRHRRGTCACSASPTTARCTRVI